MHTPPRPGARVALVLALALSPGPAMAAGDAPASATSASADTPTPSSPSPSPSNPSSLTPAEAVAAALTLHPAVLDARTALATARGARAETAVLLHNPTLSGELRTDGSRSAAALDLPLSFTGEGRAAHRGARAAVEAATLRLVRARLEAAAAARRAYVDAVVQTAQVAVAAEGVALATRLRDAVARQLEEGEASALELRLAHLAVVKASAALLEAREAEATSLQELSGMVGRTVRADALPSDPLVAAPDPTAHPPSDVDARADVRAADAALRRAEAGLARERRAALAPISVGLFVEREEGRTYGGPSLAVELPLLSRNQAGRGAARGAVDRAAADQTAITARADAEQQAARTRHTEARALAAATVDAPLAEARAALESIAAGYRAGQLDLPRAVLLQGEVLTGEAAALELRAGMARARIDLLLAQEDPRLLTAPHSSTAGGAP